MIAKQVRFDREMEARKSEDYSKLKERLSYDKATGVLRWVSCKKFGSVGKPAGHLNIHGYVVIMIDGKITWLTGLLGTSFMVSFRKT